MELVASLRFLARRKAVAAVAILTMACALGVNTSALAVLRAFLLSGLGIPDPDRVVNITPVRELPGRGEVVFNDAYPNYTMLKETQRSFAEVAVVLQNLVSWNRGTEVVPLQNARVSASFFSTMDASPILGRVFNAQEEGPSPARVIVLSHATWASGFGRDSSVVGRVITIDGAPTTVIGVMPAGFALPAPTDVWQPFDLPPQQRVVINGARTLSMFGRIADGVTNEAAAADVARFAKRALAASADNRDYRYRMWTLREQLLNGAGSTVLLVQFAAGALLLLAIINLVALLVAWGFERNQEMAVRLALGGGRAQVMRLLVAQSTIIVGAGLVVGIVLAQLLLVTVRQLDLGPQLGFFLAQARVNVAVILMCVPIAAVVALITGSLPAVVNRRMALSDALRSSSRSASHSRAALRLQRSMVVVQASLSVVVLASASVIGLSFRNLAAIPDGFITTNRVVARVILPDESYGSHASRVAFADAVLAGLAREPALRASGFSTTLPVSDVRWAGRFFVPDANGAISGDPALLHFRRISPEYLRTMGVPLLRGRHFTARDDSASTRVVIISRAFAEQYWPGEDPTGKRIFRAGTGNAPPVPFEIVGVVGDAMDGGYEAPRGQAAYVPYAQVSSTRLSIVVESAAGRREAVAAIRRAIHSADVNVAPSGLTTLGELVVSANALPQLRAAILLVLALTAVMLAGLGSYGVMRQLVANRESELSLRLVFGAEPSDLAREVWLQVARLTVPGVIVGLAGAWLASRLIRTFVFGVDPRSPVVLAAVGVGVLALAALAATPSVLRATNLQAKATMR